MIKALGGILQEGNNKHLNAQNVQINWYDFCLFQKYLLGICLTLVMSTPVILLTMSGTLVMMSRTSPVNLPAPISPSPLLTIVIFLVWDRGAATSAATWRILVELQDERWMLFTFGKVWSIMSIMAASLYSFQASAFLAICSASALALHSIA